MKRSWIKRGQNLVLWFCFALLLWLGLQNAQAVRALYFGASLRFTPPLSAQQASAARRYATQKDTNYWPSFWAEENLQAQSELREAKVRAIRFSGEGNVVYPARYLVGACPGFASRGGCAVSAEAAWRLWGSRDILGRELEIEQKRYVVQGVFEGEQPVVLLSEGVETPPGGWSAMELGGQAVLSRNQALAFAQNAGLPQPSALLTGNALGTLMEAMALLPVVLVFVGGAILLILVLRPWQSARGELMVFGCLVCFAFALPWFLAKLPLALLPTSWSDFSHWSGLWQQARQLLQEFLGLFPGLKDIGLKQRLLQQGLWMLLSLGAGAALAVLNPPQPTQAPSCAEKSNFLQNSGQR